MKKIIVAGGDGFIGSHLVDHLSRQEDTEVYVLDYRITGPNAGVPIGKLKFGSERANIHRYEVNINDLKPEMTGFFESTDTERRIYNLACPASPPLYQKYSWFTMDTSYVGTRNLLNLAKKHGARFLQASTSEVYGDPPEETQDESFHGNVNCYGPRACYDEGKRLAETLCYEANRDGSVDARVVRIFNTFGPGMDQNDGRVISNFAKAIVSGDDFELFGGSQTRSFCSVHQLVPMMVNVMEADKNHGPINIGSADNYLTIDNLARKMIGLAKNEFGSCASSIRHLPRTEDDPRRRRPNLSKYIQNFGAPPKRDFDKDLLETMRWMKFRLQDI